MATYILIRCLKTSRINSLSSSYMASVTQPRASWTPSKTKVTASLIKIAELFYLQHLWEK